MLELYEQNRAPPNQGSEAEASIAGGASNRAVSRTSAEEQVLNSNSLLAGAAAKPGSLKPPIASQLPDHSSKHAGPPKSSQNRNNDHASSDHRAHGEPRAAEPSVQQENLGDGQHMRAGTDWNSSEDSKEKNAGGNKAREGGDSKEKYHTNNIEVKEAVQTQSPAEMIEKIDANKLKEIREKRRKSRSDVIRKKDSIDEYDPILKELEEGVELAAAEGEKSKQEKKQNWSQPSTTLDHESLHHSKHLESFGDRHHVGPKGRQIHGLDSENVEEGEVSALDDSSWDYQSPQSSERKRKPGSPTDKTGDGKRWRDNVSGDFSEDKNRMGRSGYPDRDHKRHLQENHA
ncbi:hypothetical protein Cgig2_031880 [Carnegiea gigantea]|uniref:Uncharacterized protein n=1 Tax=Carnegiea gigantea TaxID=171969 RepID=A0A9Q1QNP7_9CARY|nr:hypothetical protein Cgig2_031880 [Carnegiea gigantea]